MALLERSGELGALENALRQAQRERGQLVLIEGPAGLGKTSLLKATLQLAAGLGFSCLRARASELERDFPYGCVRQLLEPALARAASAERERLFEGAAALTAPLFALGGIREPAAANDSALSMLHGLYWLLNNLAREAPVALAVDDLHWCDGESLRFFNYLAPRLDDIPLAIFASARESISAGLARLCQEPETQVLRPSPLSVEACAALCEHSLGVPAAQDFVVACHGATGGNPFFLELLLREANHRRSCVRKCYWSSARRSCASRRPKRWAICRPRSKRCASRSCAPSPFASWRMHSATRARWSERSR